MRECPTPWKIRHDEPQALRQLRHIEAAVYSEQEAARAARCLRVPVRLLAYRPQPVQDRSQYALSRPETRRLGIVVFSCPMTTVAPVAWRPAATAPRDGTRILIVVGDTVLIGAWLDPAGFSCFGERPGWQIFDCEDGFYSWAEDDAYVTHWMPLPETP